MGEVVMLLIRRFTMWVYEVIDVSSQVFIEHDVSCQEQKKKHKKKVRLWEKLLFQIHRLPSNPFRF